MRNVCLAALLISFVLPGIGHIQAQETLRVRDACRADFQTFCGDVEPGGRHVAACLKQHAPELSETCISAIKARREARRAFRQICEGDIKKFCGDVKGGRALAGCLHQHSAELQGDCAASLTGRTGNM